MELCLLGRGGGGLIIDSRGVMQKKESPEFRFPEFGISAVALSAIIWREHKMKSAATE